MLWLSHWVNLLPLVWKLQVLMWTSSLAWPDAELWYKSCLAGKQLSQLRPLLDGCKLPTWSWYWRLRSGWLGREWISCGKAWPPTQEKPEAVLKWVDLPGCNKWDPEDHWEAEAVIQDIMDIFAKDNLNLSQTSIVCLPLLQVVSLHSSRVVWGGSKASAGDAIGGGYQALQKSMGQWSHVCQKENW